MRVLTGTWDLGLGYKIDENIGECSTDGECNPFLFGTEARVDIPFTQNLSLQLDFGGEMVFAGDNLSSSSEWVGGAQAGAHLNYREVDRYLFGGFAGFGKRFQGDYSDETNHVFGGLEGQHYLGNTTLYWQGGAQFADSVDGYEFDNAWFVRGVGRHFFNAGRTKLEGELSYASGDSDGDGATVWGVGAEIEHQIHTFGGNSGLASLFGRYEGTFANVDSVNIDNHRLYVGIKLTANQDNLLTRDRMGDTLDLPNFVAWGAAVCVEQC